jgi:glycosyltransferase involved in cell wall biosynthesis
MKVAIISTEALKCPPKRYGGIESMVYDLCKGLTEAGIDITLFACNGSRSPSGKLVETIEEGWGETGQCERFEKKIKNLKDELKEFDIVHDNSHIKPCWKIHKRVINTMHWRQNPRQCHCNNVVAISETLANWIRPLNKGRKVRVVHNGCDLSKYIFKKEKGKKFLFLSALTPAKGADVALSVAKDMGLEIDFAGLGGSISGLVEQESKINSNIRYFGEVTEEEKVSLYQNAKALIFPTGAHGDYAEAFGLVCIEAMSTGTPVIAWNSGAMPEIIINGETGYLCCDMNDLKNAIRNIDNIDPERCRDHVAQNFTYQAMSKKYIKLYKKLLNGHSW